MPDTEVRVQEARADETDDLINQLGRDLLKEDVGYLSFEGRQLKLDSAQDAHEIVEKLSKCECLETFCLSGNTLGVEAGKSIGDALASHSELKTLLWSDLFTGRLKLEIPEALKNVSSGIISAGAKLVHLDLSDNAFGPNGLPGIVDLLTSPSCYSLKILKLNNNGLGVFGAEILAKALSDCHARSLADQPTSPFALETFICGRNRLENKGSSLLSASFKTIGTLKEISLPQNGIQHKGIEALADAFIENHQLTTIDISDNIFTEKGAAAMAKALNVLTELSIVNFDDCLTRTDGAISIADSLSGTKHQSLREVHLQFNEIRLRGALSLVSSVSDKPNFSKLFLDGNQLGEEGVEQIKMEMRLIDKSDCLGSLSEDEGIDSDEEDVEDDDDNGDKDSEPEEDQEDADVEPADITVIEASLEEPPSSITVTEFLRSNILSEDMFKKVTKESREDLFTQQILKPSFSSSSPEDLQRTIHLLLKMCTIVTPNGDSAVKDEVCRITDRVLSRLLTYTTDTSTSSDVPVPGATSSPVQVGSAIVTELGLIKTEDKYFGGLSSSDLAGPLIVLSSSVKQSYFHLSALQIIQTLVERPNNKFWQSYKEERHMLLQTCYQR